MGKSPAHTWPTAFVLEISNNMPYAEHLQNKEGFFVLDPGAVQGIVEETIGETFAHKIPTPHAVEAALMAAGDEIINWHREFIAETRPPLRAGEGPRIARRGHWADDSNYLQRAYQWDVRTL